MLLNESLKSMFSKVMLRMQATWGSGGTCLEAKNDVFEAKNGCFEVRNGVFEVFYIGKEPKIIVFERFWGVLLLKNTQKPLKNAIFSPATHRADAHADTRFNTHVANLGSQILT
jgi:hypothetical protein